MRLGTLLRTRLDHLHNERLTRPQLEARQLAKFRRLVRFAQRRSPYYARVIAERKIDPEHCTPQDFPVLTKRDVAQQFDELVTDRGITREALLRFLERSRDPGELFLDYFNVVHTSGSSGEPGCFVYSPHDWTRAAMPYLQKALAEKAAVDLKPFAADAKKKITAALADFQQNENGVRVAAQVRDVRLTGIAFDSKTLRVIAEADGAAKVAVSQLPRM